MLKTLDVLLGVIAVMLLMSLAVTALTQFLTTLVNSRGRHLLHGLAALLRQIDPALDRGIAKQIAATLLAHPLIRDAAGRYGAVIHREELTELMLELAAGTGPAKLPEAAKQALARALAANGIDEPAKALAAVWSAALEIEKAQPEMAALARRGAALVREAGGAFLLKINGWFDQTMDRVSERFTLSTRAITLATGLVVAFALQLDTVALVNRLWDDSQLRDALVTEALKADGLAGHEREALASLAREKVIGLPRNAAQWADCWRASTSPDRLPGILLSALLMSLGAPFWYNALKELVRLRPALAAKEDGQRAGRRKAA